MATINFRTFNKSDIDNKATAREYHDMLAALSEKKATATLPLLICDGAGIETYKTFTNRIATEMANASGVKLFTKVSLATLKMMHQDKKLLLNYYDENGNLIIENKRQRNEVTSPSWKSNLFVSVITGMLMDTPSLYIIKNRMTTVDGNQRITAIVKILTDKMVITGTGTKLDGKKFSMLDDDLQEAILNVKIDVMVLHPNLADEKFLDRVFANMNGKQNKVNKAEQSVATSDTAFRNSLQEFVNDAARKTSKQTDVYRLLGNTHAKNSRMRDIEGILFAQALVNGENVQSHGHAVEIMLGKYPDTIPAMKEGAIMMSTIKKNFAQMANIFGLTATSTVEREEGVVVYHRYDPKADGEKYSQYTDSARLCRSNTVSSKYFISLYYATGLLTKYAGIDTTGKNFQYHHAFTDAMRGIWDKIVVTDAFDKAMTGGPGDKTRSRRLAKTFVSEVINDNIPICIDATMDAIVRENWEENILNDVLSNAKTEVFEWR